MKLHGEYAMLNPIYAFVNGPPTIDLPKAIYTLYGKATIRFAEAWAGDHA